LLDVPAEKGGTRTRLWQSRGERLTVGNLLAMDDGQGAIEALSATPKNSSSVTAQADHLMLRPSKIWKYTHAWANWPAAGTAAI
jgi:hypothetical protein